MQTLKEQDKDVNQNPHTKPDSSSTIDAKFVPNNSTKVEESSKQSNPKSEVKK